MNTNQPEPTVIFRDQTLADLELQTPLVRACQEPSDIVEAGLRVLLVLCILISPLLCSMQPACPLRVSAPSSATKAQFPPPAVSKLPIPA